MAIEEKKEIIGKHAEEVSSDSAIEEVARDIEQATEKTETTQAAEPSAEQTIPVILPEVQEAGIKAVLPPHHEMLSGSEVHAGSVDGSGVAFPPKESAVIKALFDSRKHLGPADKSSTWNNLEGIRDKLLELVRGKQQKVA